MFWIFWIASRSPWIVSCSFQRILPINWSPYLILEVKILSATFFRAFGFTKFFSLLSTYSLWFLSSFLKRLGHHLFCNSKTGHKKFKFSNILWIVTVYWGSEYLTNSNGPKLSYHRKVWVSNGPKFVNIWKDFRCYLKFKLFRCMCMYVLRSR